MSDNKKIEKLKRIAIDIPIEKHKEIKVAAASLGISIKDFVEEALYFFGRSLNRDKND
jgi:predicted HicB family RNase H-like nuclease